LYPLCAGEIGRKAEKGQNFTNFTKNIRKSREMRYLIFACGNVFLEKNCIRMDKKPKKQSKNKRICFKS
jgi:hypothetical protein